MKKYRSLAGFFMIPVIVIVLMIFIVINEPPKGGISRAEAARAMTLAVVSPEEFESWVADGWASHFAFSAEEAWYVSYLDFMYSKEYLNTEDTPADRSTAEGMLTYGEAARIAEKTEESLAQIIRCTDAKKDKMIPEHLWWKLYDAIRKVTDPEEQIREEKMMVYGTAKNIPEIQPWHAYTDMGIRIFSGLNLDSCIDHEITALVRGNELIRIMDDRSDLVYKNVWIQSGSGEKVQILLNGINRELSFRKAVKKPEELVQNMADLTISDGKIVKVALKKDHVQGKLLSRTEDTLEIEGYGSIPLDLNCQYLKTYGELQMVDPAGILVGSDNLEYVVADGNICAVLEVRAADESRIRVLITNQGFQGIYHDQISLKSDASMNMLVGDQETHVNEGEVLTFVPGDERLKQGRLVMVPFKEHEITVTSLERTDGMPSYGGRLEIVEQEEGLVLINETSLEDYIRKVIPSEMPAEYELEALKAQAVCARTYAYTQMRGSKYAWLGAQVDDSTNYQVYNNCETDSRTDQAVQETYGKLLMCGGQPISAYYFSTSCGNTTDGSVWDMDPEDVPYLKSVSLRPNRRSYDWSNEQEFVSWIKNSKAKSYDSEYPFFRWKVTTNAEILGRTFDSIGEIKSLRVVRRGAGGVALELLIKGSNGELVISGQNSIRTALGDTSLKIWKADGKSVEGWSTLPSAFLTVEPDGRDENGIQKFTIYGGGYGHGAGMSQNGAQAMAKSGMKYDEILKFFYENTEIQDW